MMQINKINSSQNPKIKTLKKLQDKKYRKQYNQFIIENFKIVLDAAKAGHFFSELFVTDVFFTKHQKQIDFLCRQTGQTNIYLIDEKINQYFSSLVTPSGIAAIYPLVYTDISFDQPLIYLNQIADPGNLGTILRTAVAFKFKNIVVDELCVDLFNFKTLNAGKEAIFKLNIAIDSRGSLLKQIKKKMPVIVTSLQGQEDPAVLHSKKPFCLVLGSEAHGVSSEIVKIGDVFYKINISENIDSLNVACAAAILFYEITKHY